ncbi:MAG TPA: 16S rRNA (cytosine(1402)-N(4))-methyltransferase RsmH [Candidatus Acidoferrales bacterium]|nr:16S rRNA (cytosine(1402)-N(4))-methyltransferase RsmH [Candidatus Acidoferrales bacterium]
MVPFHEPVLLKESIDFLVTDLSATYVDATFGGGGHTRELLSRLNSGAKVIAFDVDEHAKQNADRFFSQDGRFSFVEKNFSEIRNVFDDINIISAAGFLFDLGVSSYQLDNEPGFSYRRDEKLDMRLDKDLKTSAYDVINSYDVEELSAVFGKYGEEPRSRLLAKAIVKRRGKNNIETTSEFVEIIGKVCGSSAKTLARIFQALRIEVNNELNSLFSGLKAAIDMTSLGGRIVVISYHSLEDRIVKERFKYEAATCVCPPQAIVCTCGKTARARILTRKPISPSRDEVLRNRRARSAKMRAIERIA